MSNNIKKFEEREIRYMYEVEDFSDTIRNESLQVVHNGFEKCVVENIEEIKDIDHGTLARCNIDCAIFYLLRSQR